MLESLYMVIVNWNLKQDTVECIRSLLSGGVLPDRIILVDNGSTDGSVEAVRQQFVPAPRIIKTGSNLGFAGGVNAGVLLAQELGAQWVFLLNNDTIAAPDLLVYLEKAVIENYGLWIYSPLVLNFYDQKLIDTAGDRQIMGTLITQSLFKNQPAELVQSDIEVDFVTGCAVLIPIKAFQTVGYFDTRFFMYAEDADFCQRCRKVGYRFRIAYQARVYHKISLSSHHDRPRQRIWRIRNQAWFYRLHAAKIQIPLLFIFTLLRAFIIGGKDLADLQSDMLMPLFRGWWQGWFGAIPRVYS